MTTRYVDIHATELELAMLLKAVLAGSQAVRRAAAGNPNRIRASQDIRALNRILAQLSSAKPRGEEVVA